MSNAIYDVPVAVNEPVLSYAPGSVEREELKMALAAMKSRKVEIPMYIGGKEVKTKTKVTMRPPHEIKHKLGHFYKGTAKHVDAAIKAALAAKPAWENMPWQERAAIFLKAADLLSGPYRAKMNAATMLAQSKNAYQAEIDAVAEFCDFLRFNVQFMTQIYSEQPESAHGIWNRMEHRPLEGFIFAITPFNFTSIAGNLCAAPALMGNTIVWKPAETQIYSAAVIMEIFEAAGLPAGVVNLVYVDGPAAGDVVFKHPDFAGLHFTGSTGVFQKLWQTIGQNITKYKTYPRIVGETGGKDFIVAHPSAKAKQVATAITRGAFEFQGQKCSAASRAYISKSIWNAVKKQLIKDVNSFKMGSPEDMGNFITSVIHEASFNKIKKYINKAKKDKKADIIIGGGCDKSKGYFIEPTVIVTTDPKYITMCDELFGPVITIYVFDDKNYSKTLKLVDETSDYALTGAVVGQQPFGGARGSGTNDKAGSILNLQRWVSPRMIKETFVTPTDYRYPFLG